MAANTTLSDKGLVWGSVKVTIDGYVYLLKTGARQKPVLSAKESDEYGRPEASAHVTTWETFTAEIMAYTGTPEPAQLVPFSYGSDYWTVGNLTLNYATEGVRSYSCELHKLAGTSGSDFTVSSV